MHRYLDTFRSFLFFKVCHALELPVRYLLNTVLATWGAGAAAYRNGERTQNTQNDTQPP